MKNVDHSYEQALIMHENVHIHFIMNIIVTPTYMADKGGKSETMNDPLTDRGNC